jgi:hypothetical protein
VYLGHLEIGTCGVLGDEPMIVRPVIDKAEDDSIIFSPASNVS